MTNFEWIKKTLTRPDLASLLIQKQTRTISIDDHDDPYDDWDFQEDYYIIIGVPNIEYSTYTEALNATFEFLDAEHSVNEELFHGKERLYD